VFATEIEPEPLLTAAVIKGCAVPPKALWNVTGTAVVLMPTAILPAVEAVPAVPGLEMVAPGLVPVIVEVSIVSVGWVAPPKALMKLITTELGPAGVGTLTALFKPPCVVVSGVVNVPPVKPNGKLPTVEAACVPVSCTIGIDANAFWKVIGTLKASELPTDTGLLASGTGAPAVVFEILMFGVVPPVKLMFTGVKTGCAAPPKAFMKETGTLVALAVPTETGAIAAAAPAVTRVMAAVGLVPPVS